MQKKYLNYYKLKKEDSFVELIEEINGNHYRGTRLKIINYSNKKTAGVFSGLIYSRSEGHKSFKYKRIHELDKYLKKFCNKKGYEIISSIYPDDNLDLIFNNLEKIINNLK